MIVNFNHLRVDEIFVKSNRETCNVSAVWSALELFIFITLYCDTQNWPNVFLWWINYRLNHAWTWPMVRFESVCSADVQMTRINKFPSDTSIQVFSSSSSELRSFIAIYASIRWDMMLKHGNWLLILFDNKFRKYLEKKLMDFFILSFNVTRNCWDQ